MNNRNVGFSFLLCLLAISVAAKIDAQATRTSSGEEFFIVASVDLAKSQLLLKHPTEVTTLLGINDKTKWTDAMGKLILPADLHTGDTVWVVTSGTGQNAIAIRIRKGPMTVAELHHLYVDYPEIK
jgi:hypothetical protein